MSTELSNEKWTWPASKRGQIQYMVKLRPTQLQRTQNLSALGKIAHVCHQQTDLDVHTVTTCGSVGKKTDSTLCSDLDLVVRINHLNAKDLQQQVPTILAKIQAAMDQQYPNTRDKDWYQKFGLRYVIGTVEIDILVGAMNVNPSDFLQVSNSEERAYMSASVSHLAKRFIVKQNLLFKDLVRVVKHWRDSYSWERSSKPKSYLLELIMLHVFLKFRLCNKLLGRTYYPYPNWWAERLLKEFFRTIGEDVPPYKDVQTPYSKNHLPTLFVCFEPYYTKAQLQLDDIEPILGQKRKVRGRWQTKYATAIVMDPVNPTNNVWLTLVDSGVLLVDRAKTTYQTWQSTS